MRENKAPKKIYLPKGNYDYLCNNGKYTGCYTEKGHETEVCFILESEHNRITSELQKEIDRLKAENEWISVKERLPETKSNGSYRQSIPILAYSDGIIFKSRYETNNNGEHEFSQWYCTLIDDTIDDVTHWMPLPQPPKQ